MLLQIYLFTLFEQRLVLVVLIDWIGFPWLTVLLLYSQYSC